MTARPYWRAASVGSRRPSPGRSCTLTVETTYDDGHRDTRAIVWDGYTAAEARTLCVARLREAGHKIHAGCDGSITTHHVDGSTQTLTWTDNPTVGGDAP